MRVLLLIAHANHNGISTSHRLAAAAELALKEDNHEVKVVDLVTSGFDRVATVDDFTRNPRPDHFDYEACHVPGNDNLIPLIREHQELVTWCSHIIVIGPMWYYRYPATFYAWAERVLNQDFGYTATEFRATGPLVGRKAMCVITLGCPESTFAPDGPQSTIEGIMYHITRGHWSYVGITSLRTQAFYECTQDKSLCDHPVIMEKWKKAVKNLDRRPEVPLGDAVTPVGPGKPNELHILAGLADLSLDDAINA